ncbi:MAG TPA: ABC transporter permease, partial [Verrucomicrobiae bacterium]
MPAGLPSFLMLNFGTCAMFIFFVGTALVAAMSFGTEFQQRTLPLLLSQPFERARLWRDKLLVLTAATVSVGVIYWLSQNLLVAAAARQSAFAGRGALLSGLFLLATACSS